MESRKGLVSVQGFLGSWPTLGEEKGAADADGVEAVED